MRSIDSECHLCKRSIKPQNGKRSIRCTNLGWSTNTLLFVFTMALFGG